MTSKVIIRILFGRTLGQVPIGLRLEPGIFEDNDVFGVIPPILDADMVTSALFLRKIVFMLAYWMDAKVIAVLGCLRFSYFSITVYVEQFQLDDCNKVSELKIT